MALHIGFSAAIASAPVKHGTDEDVRRSASIKGYKKHGRKGSGHTIFSLGSLKCRVSTLLHWFRRQATIVTGLSEALRWCHVACWTWNFSSHAGVNNIIAFYAVAYNPVMLFSTGASAYRWAFTYHIFSFLGRNHAFYCIGFSLVVTMPLGSRQGHVLETLELPLGPLGWGKGEERLGHCRLDGSWAASLMLSVSCSS